MVSREVIESVKRIPVNGRNQMCRYPFHPDKTGSLRCYPAGKGFHCFGCGASGSVIDFAMKYQGLSFLDAIKVLAAQFGIETENEISETLRADIRTRQQMRQRELEKREKRKKELSARLRTDAEMIEITERYGKLDYEISCFLDLLNQDWEATFETYCRLCKG